MVRAAGSARALSPRPLPRALPVATLAAVLSACSQGAPRGEGCLSNRDCPSGEQCVSGSCLAVMEKGCTSDDACPLGQYCDIATHACLPLETQEPPPEPECTADAACPAHQRCDLGTGTCVNGRRSCTAEADCAAIGQRCDTGKGTCVDCFTETDCTSPMKCTEGECVDPSLSTSCNDDTACAPPSTICVAAQCTRGCTSPSGLTCGAEETCNASTGRCDPRAPDPDPNACTSDPQCGAPSAVCENGRCFPGCAQIGGLTCAAGNVCDTTTGRCVAVSGPCTQDSQCNAPASVCELGQCVPGCGRAGGVQCSGATRCNPSSGRCEMGTGFCSSDLDCSTPAEVCNLSTGDCDPGCGAAGCPSGETCNTATGHCAGAATCGSDGYEPNDTRQTASAVAGGTLYALFACPGNDDHYTMTLGPGDVVTIDANFAIGEGDLDVELLDASGAVLAAGNTRGSNEHVTFTAAAAGAVVVRVFLVSDYGPTPGTSYSLAIANNVAPCAEDTYEENDSELFAASVAQGTIPGLRICPSDEDFFAIPVSAGDEITATVTFDQTEGDLDIRLLNPIGFSVASSGGTGNSESLTFTANLTGTYVLRVYLFGDAGAIAGNSYTAELTWGSAPPPPPPTCTADAEEENDTSATAGTISPGSYGALTLCTGDDDYYALSLGNGDQVSVSLAFTDAEGDIDLQLLDSAGAVLQSSSGVTDTETVGHTTTAAGTYVIRTTLYGDAGSSPGNTYSMTVAVTSVSGCPNDGYEPNNTRQAAIPMSLGTFPSLSVCTMDDDFFAVSLSAGETLSIDVTLNNSEGDVDVAIQDSAGTVLDSSQTTTNTETIDFTATAADTYYVRVYLYADYGTVTGSAYGLTLAP